MVLPEIVWVLSFGFFCHCLARYLRPCAYFAVFVRHFSSSACFFCAQCRSFYCPVPCILETQSLHVSPKVRSVESVFRVQSVRCREQASSLRQAETLADDRLTVCLTMRLWSIHARYISPLGVGDCIRKRGYIARSAGRKALDFSVSDYFTFRPREVSRRHFKITQDQMESQKLYLITDLGSTCGTYLNGALLEPQKENNSGVEQVLRNLWLILM